MKMLSLLIAVVLLSVSVYARQVQLTPENTVTIRTEIDYASTETAQLELMKLVAKRGKATYPIYLVIDSPGGGIDAGNSFVELAKTIKNLETITIFAASMASSIVQQLPGRRLIIESGVSMYHRAAGGFQGQFEDGELESRLNFYKNIVRSMEQKAANRMNISLADYKKLVKDELWVLGKDAVKSGVADEVIALSCSQELLAGSKVVSIAVFMFSMEVQFNNCPLLRGGSTVEPKNSEEYLKFQSKKTMGYIWKT